MLPLDPKSPIDRRRAARRATVLSRLLAAVLALPALAACDATASESAVERMNTLVLSERFTTGRLSNQTAWRECGPVDTTAIVPNGECGREVKLRSGLGRRLRKARKALNAAGDPADSPGLLHAHALHALAYSRSNEEKTDDAVEALRRATEVPSPDSARLLNDLAVALIAKAEWSQEITPSIEALEAIERAAEVDSTSLSIRFNRALTRERLYLVRTALLLWKRYLQVETDSMWKDEARRHIARLEAMQDTFVWDTVIDSLPSDIQQEEITELVRKSPQDALEAGIKLLAQWGQAVVDGKPEEGAPALERARMIGEAARQLRTDESIRLQVEAIDANAHDTARTRLLAEGHVRLAGAMKEANGGSKELAVKWSTEALERFERVGSPASHGAAYYRGMGEVEWKHYDSAHAWFRQVELIADSLEPTLKGKAIASRGTAEVRQGHYDSASTWYKLAEPYFDSAGETNQRHYLSYVLSESYTLSGRIPKGRDEAYRGLKHLAPYRRSKYLNNLISNLATTAAEDRFYHAALAISDEVLEIAPGVDGGDKVPLALRARARFLIGLGKLDSARIVLDSARTLTDISNSGVRAEVGRVAAELLMKEGRTREARDTLLKIQGDVVPVYAPTILYMLGQVFESLGQTESARANFVAAIDTIEKRQETFRDPATRASYLETVEKVFDAMIRMELAAGRPDSALAYLERGREVAWKPLVGSSEGRADRRRTWIAELQRELPDRTVLLDYALLQDRLEIWTVSRDRIGHQSVPVGRVGIQRLVRRLAIDMRDEDVRTGDARVALFDLLLRPVEGAIRKAEQLYIVPDRELHQVSFAALWDTTAHADSPYVMQRWVTSQSPNAGFLLDAVRAPSQVPNLSRALVVGNPTLADSLGLDSLAYAEEEAKEIARHYEVRPLMGRAASKQAVMEAMRRTSVIHFAGHSVYNRDQPELSYLALAPDKPGDDGLLYAWEIDSLSLSNVKVAVLSACSTLNPRPTRAGATAGLAYSFLRGGVPGIVSTIQDVRDDETEFLRHFHEALKTLPPAEALRQAQLIALGSKDPRQRKPSAWAAFIYTGR